LTLTVTELSKYLQKKLNKDSYLQSLQIIGEVSNHHAAQSGHHYFSLKDEESIIKCVLFAGGDGGGHLTDGDQILASGKISFYQARGDLQFYAEEITPYGIGTLQQQFEKLKLKLEAEGLFDLSRKRPIPEMPKVIGIVTSKTGSVIQDILNVIQRRYAHIKIIIADTRVQGENAASSITESITNLNKLRNIDLVIIARGGGSLEDLWPFNEESVARAIYASNIPIISAVGHETDTTISDLVADLRAPTPSAAAELSTPNVQELKEMINTKLLNMILNVNKIMSGLRGQYSMSVDRFLNYKPETSTYKIKVYSLKQELLSLMQARINDSKLKILNLKTSLNHLNFEDTLSRGFFISSRKKDNSIIKNLDSITIGERLIFSNLQGKIETETIEITKNKGGINE
jgi:exodeoxyribonuclease VII large subunit